MNVQNAIAQWNTKNQFFFTIEVLVILVQVLIDPNGAKGDLKLDNYKGKILNPCHLFGI